ncbi:hypothetical protein TCT1_07300 [Xenorhabdus sp. TCT-1]|uniref:Uncharacterized protein n=1 Tax=Xenorhabdus taiwanensis TaxID=3085177 RepID=A0ABN7C1M7_9GAMM|nr:hypothetical protein TCT1_07300 [Xenorhabdus sp. TCT-1]
MPHVSIIQCVTIPERNKKYSDKNEDSQCDYNIGCRDVSYQNIIYNIYEL